MAQLALRHRLMPRRSWIRGGRKRKVAKMASWRLGTWMVKAAAVRLLARRRFSTGLRAGGASCGGTRRLRLARLSSSCWRLRKALRALAHPELGGLTKAMELMEPLELLLPLLESMKMLLVPLKLVEPLELKERKSLLLLE